MKLQQLIGQYNDRVVGPDWYPFVGYMDSIYAELNQKSTIEADRHELLGAQEKLQYGYLIDRDRTLFQRLIAAELLSQLAIDMSVLEQGVSILLDSAQQEQNDDYLVAASLAAHLVHAIDTQPKIESIVGFMRKESERKIFELRERIVIALLRRRPILAAPDPPDIRTARTMSGLLPGDCLFRRQSRPWYGNPFRDFGHAGLYIGCVDPTDDVSDCSNHVVIHVISDKPACRLTTLHEFCNPDGTSEQFWGAYQADLTSAERSKVIATAYSFVNDCTYSFTGGYKNDTGKSFRCDGFVEHCYESATPSILPLSYRGGLFEGDNWKVMNPKALRNCLVKKVASDLAPCCNS